jgi:hypothetical protein
MSAIAILRQGYLTKIYGDSLINYCYRISCSSFWFR